jgi:TonB dependent receptor-like, beta-barrel/Carboxypeptidase regulatory-like domain/TonB-dependent Receptor Plug Domain
MSASRPLPVVTVVSRALRRAIVLLPLLSTPLLCQETTPYVGRIVGRIIDASTGNGLSDVGVQVVGTTLGATSGVDGRYSIPNVPAGTVTIQVRRIGYTPKSITGIMLAANKTLEQNIVMETAAITIAEQTVTAARERGTVASALNDQRTAVGVTNSVTAEAIAKSPDSDAAHAIQRVSGVTVQDGKYVFVRGLGERYTTTSLNGARVPSPEPEKKVVPLDLFPSNLLETITTSKTFTPDQPGDFSGAQVNLKTRSFPAERLLQMSLSSGFNSIATGKEILTPPTAGREWLAMAAGQRELPARLTGVTDFTQLTPADINGLIRALPNDWMFSQASGSPNVSGSMSVGGEDPVFGHGIGYIGSVTYSRSQELHDGEIRARAVPGDASATPVPYNEFVGSTGQSSVLWGGMVNLSTYLGRSTKVELNNTYDRTADNIAHLDWGTLEEFPQVDSVRRSSLRYVERTVRSDQLHVEHQLGERNHVEWSVTSSGVTRDEPDRSDLAYGYEIAATGERLPLAWLGFIPEAAKRTSSSLKEDALSGSLGYALSLGRPERTTVLKIGGDYRHTNRDAHTASYNLRANGLSAAERTGSPEQIFYGSYTAGSEDKITLEPNTGGGTYDAKDNVSAGYAMAEIPLGSRVRVIGGARVEQWHLDMNAQPVSLGVIQITRRNTDVLPSLAIDTTIRQNQTLRLSASQTLARPEYRELAPVSYRDMLGEREVFGDSSLVRTLVQNYDLRWEWYPNYTEVLSLAVFAKHFDKPIEPIDVATSGASQLSFINAQSAFNYGVELEMRKGLGFLTPSFTPFAVFSNVTLIKSRINTSNSNLSALTNDQRPMVGQAPYVVNTGLSYSNLSGSTNATLLYNVVGKRISSAAVTPVKVDTYERPRPQLDFSLRFPMRGGVKAKLDATNLLDAPYEERQGDVVRYRYRTGRSFSLGASWQR